MQLGKLHLLLMKIVSLMALIIYSLTAQVIISDHTTCDLTRIPLQWIDSAKTNLHIAYGHTSHGSQITTGMTGLVGFINNGGLELDYPENTFAWNHTGMDGALHLYEGDGYGSGDLDHDAGYYPDWINETTDYLGEPDANGRGSHHPEINVLMWSWCGQVSGYTETYMNERYLIPMDTFETAYPGITFVYMTGHLDGSGEEGNLHQRNEQIRQFCISNGKVLYDFADIESWDPDGNYFLDLYAEDDCDYDSDGDGAVDANWADEWQNAHTEGYDWYNCTPAHTRPLNGNLKAYAAWWLWARLAGWDPSQNIEMEDQHLPVTCKLQQNYPNPFNPGTTIGYDLFIPARVELTIYNALGQELDLLVDEEQAPDHYEIFWNASGCSSGIYYIRLKAGNKVERKKMLLIK